jgi:hypothetical protein
MYSCSTTIKSIEQKKSMAILRFQASAKKNGLGALWFPHPEPYKGCERKQVYVWHTIEQNQQQLASKTDTIASQN